MIEKAVRKPRDGREDARLGCGDWETVDYFIFGIGFGASLVLLGWGLHQYGPGLRFRRDDADKEVLRAEEMILRQDWTRFCTALGALLLVAGAIVLLATVVTLLVRPSDRVGSIIAGTLFVLVLAGVAVWIGLFVNQHQGLGFRSEASIRRSAGRRRPQPVEAPVLAADDAAAAEPEMEPAPVSNEHPERHRVRPASVQRHPRSRGQRAPRTGIRPVVANESTPRDVDDDDRSDDREVVEPVAAEPDDRVATETARPDRPAGRSRESQADQGGEDTTGVVMSRPPFDAQPEPVAARDEEMTVEPEESAEADTDHGEPGEDIVSSVSIRVDGRAQERITPASDDENRTEPADGDDEPLHPTARMAPAHDLALANLRLRRMSRSVAKDS